AESSGAIEAHVNDSLTAIVVLSMALTPLAVLATRRLTKTQTAPNLDGVEVAHGLSGSVLIIGFGRFGQVMSQLLLARGVDVTIIDTDIDMIQNAEKFGFKIYYGDGSRLDILHASGAAQAQAIVVCVDNKETTNRIVELVAGAFPLAKLLVRTYDREHSLHLVKKNVDYMIRETFESAMVFGGAILQQLDVDEDQIAQITREIRERDNERFETEVAADDIYAGADLQYSHAHPRPTAPLLAPRQSGQI